MTPVLTGTDAPHKAPTAFSWAVIAWVSVLLAVCYAPVLLALVRQWSEDPDMGHGFFVPLIAAAIAWHKRDQIAGLAPKPNWWGLVIMVWAGLQWQEMDDAGKQTDRLICLYGQQVSELSKQAGDTHDLAVAAKAQSDQTKTIAKQAVVQANAAKSAAKTADEALHISERAYVVAGHPSMNASFDTVSLPIVNTGHIPSGKVKAIIHEATTVVIPNSSINPSIETHWKHYTLESVPTSGQVMNFTIKTPNLNAAQFKSGHQQVLIVGVISYNDGFPDDPELQWNFCFGDAIKLQANDSDWVICDSASYLAQAISADHYPNNEYKEPN